jgi:hypothetical protein
MDSPWLPCVLTSWQLYDNYCLISYLYPLILSYTHQLAAQPADWPTTDGGFCQHSESWFQVPRPLYPNFTFWWLWEPGDAWLTAKLLLTLTSTSVLGSETHAFVLRPYKYIYMTPAIATCVYFSLHLPFHSPFSQHVSALRAIIRWVHKR